MVVSPATVSICASVARCGPPVRAVLDAAVLVAEGDFEVEDFLAGALETKMAGLDDAGVHRADGDLVNLAAVDAEELAHGGRGAGAAADGFEPRVAVGNEAVLLPDLALEEMGLRVRGGERRVRAGGRRAAADGERVVGIEGDDGDEPRGGAGGHAEPGGEATAAGEFGGGGAHEIGGGPLGDVGPRERGGVGQKGEGRRGAHGAG
jgi:hypothetical protein